MTDTTNPTTITFDCETHEARLRGYSYDGHDPDTVAAYQAWWQALPEDERQRYQKQRWDFEAKEREEQQALETRQARLSALRETGMPEKDIRPILLGQLSETTALEAARELMASTSMTSLALFGPNGVGKSFAGSWAVATATDDILAGRKADDDTWGLKTFRHSYARFITAAQLARTSMYDEKAMNSLERVGLLVIDDLGVEYNDAKGSFLSLFNGLFNARYAAQLRTILTSNLPGDEFKERYGERVIDRIRETGKFIGIEGESLRG